MQQDPKESNFNTNKNIKDVHQNENEQKKVCPFAVSRKKGLSVMGCLICEHHNCERGTR